MSREFAGKPLPPLEQLEAEYIKIVNYIDFLLYKKQPDEFINRNSTWDNQLSCNLYASTFFACLGLQNTFSHRVDSQNNPVIYIKNTVTGMNELLIEIESGHLTKPVGQVRELSAQGTHNWMIENGNKHGWVDITNLTYSEKVEKLKDGYVFHGSDFGHNWVIIGLTIDGNFQPVLTQATNNVILNVFGREEDILKIDRNIDFDERNSFYASGYKLMPQFFGDTDSKIFAIKPKK